MTVVTDDKVILGHLFLPDGDGLVQLENDEGDDDAPKLFRKVILRTGSWKIRPTESGPVHRTLKVFRDQAPKGHISLTELKKNFDAGLVEHVAVPLRHDDRIEENTGFVRALDIKDHEDGSSELVADIEFTEPDIAGKIERGTIPNVSSGILFDWPHKESGKRIGQILDHVCLTRRPWINKLPAFGTALAEEEMLDDQESFEFESASTIILTPDYRKSLPNSDFALADERRYPIHDLAHARHALKRCINKDEEEKVKSSIFERYSELNEENNFETTDDSKSGSLIWRPEEGIGWIRAELEKVLRETRRSKNKNGMLSYEDVPYYSVEDVSGSKVLITEGYGNNRSAWVATFSVNENELELQPEDEWVAARPEWVTAAQQYSEPVKPELVEPVARSTVTPVPLSPLQLAQRARDERMAGESRPRNEKKGGSNMGLKLSADDLKARGVELSAEEEQELRVQEEEDRRKDDEIARLRQNDRTRHVKDKVTELSELGFETNPGLLKFVKSALLSDDGGTAIEFSDYDDDGVKLSGSKSMTITQFVDGFIEKMPRNKEGNLILSDQAAELPGDEKPEEKGRKTNKDDEIKLSASERAAHLEDELDLPWARELETVGKNGGNE